MRVLLLVLLVTLTSCLSQVCPENLNLTAENYLNHDQRPSIRSLDKVYDRTISIEGEPYTLIIYATNNHYYVRHEPARSAITRLYGPYEGDGIQAMQCQP